MSSVVVEMWAWYALTVLIVAARLYVLCRKIGIPSGSWTDHSIRQIIKENVLQIFQTSPG